MVTAEIAVMNKMAIALAADSATTISIHKKVDDVITETQKIHDTANKLFTLSKYEPIGCMIYGNAAFMGVPWEIIIKRYRGQLGRKSFADIDGYVNDFCSFIRDDELLIPTVQEEINLLYLVTGYFQYIIKQIKENMNDVTQNYPIEKETAKNIIDKNHQELKEIRYVKEMTSYDARKILRVFGKKINSVISYFFKDYELTEDSRKKLREICGWILTKEIFSNNASGIVIAGFGSEDMFPSLMAFYAESMIFRKLKYKIIDKRCITFSNTSEIIPFAQGDMVYTFITGASPSYRDTMRKMSQETLKNWRDKFKEVAAVSPEAQNALKMMEDEIKGLLNELEESMDKHCKSEKLSLKAAVGSLSKDELAAMAESLVHLTSLKQKMSLEAESVGGPIDVAVISKGDGFIWIKRKHYFDPSLNHHFFENYFGEKRGNYGAN